jgi:PKHD-type hydroxylase
MRLKHDWWLFKKGIVTKDCNKIIKTFSSFEKDKGITGQFGKNRDIKEKPLTKKEKENLIKQRDSSVVFLSDQLTYDIIMPLVFTANKSSDWNFEINYTEASQFTEYKKNNFYDWHQDCWNEPYSIENNNYANKIRKLSSVLLLEDNSKYKGGDFQFYFHNNPEQKPKIITLDTFCDKGDFLVFPSHIWHRVLPVTKGKRYSLVNWHLGHPFK